MIKKLAMIIMIAMSICSVACAQPYKLVHYEYEVQAGETLTDIGQKFIEKNTYGDRSLKEFTEGIVEINPELWNNRETYAGEVIYINWFEKI